MSPRDQAPGPPLASRATRPSRAIPRSIIASALLGILTTVLTAWVCAAWASLGPPTPPVTMISTGGAAWHLRVQRGVGLRRHSAWSLDPATAAAASAQRLPPGAGRDRALAARGTWMAANDLRSTGTGITYGWIDDEAGWPLPAAASETRIESVFLSAPRLVQTRWGIPLKTGAAPAWGGEPPTSLPLRPLWLGFVGNTLFWGLLWLGVLAAPASIRRRLRRRRGLCEQCAYDLRGLVGTMCPECGGVRG